MKFNKTTLLSVICGLCLTTAYGQSESRDIQVTQESVTTDGENVYVRMRVEAEKLDIRCNGSYRLIPAIEKGDVKLALPEIVYSGSLRYRFDRRRELLSGGDNYPEPYYIDPKANKRKPETVEYHVSVPLLPWMNGATVTYEWVRCGCGGEEVLWTGYAPRHIEEQVQQWIPNPAVYRDVVFYTPENSRENDEKGSRGKRELAKVEMYLNFPQDVPDILVGFADNAAELAKSDSLMNFIFSNNLNAVTELRIHGYASPEGAYWRNRNLSRYRAENFHKYLKSKYNLTGIPVQEAWTPVDWEGLTEMLTTSDVPFRDDALTIVSDARIPDEMRERLLRRVGGGIPHKTMYKQMYPKLRRTVLLADLRMDALPVEQASKMMLVRPELLSQEEMYRVALSHPAGSASYVDAFIAAARYFPDDFTANNNAAAAILQTGNAEAAYRYIVKIAHDPRAYSNVGTYYYILGDVEKARQYYRMASRDGVAGAEEQLKKTGEEKQ